MAVETLPTTKRVELFRVKEFATSALVDHDKAFVAWSQRTKISPSQSPPSIRTTPTFSLSRLCAELLERTGINDYPYQDDLPSHPSVLQYCFSVRKTVAFSFVSEILVTWPSRTGICYLWLRLYPPSWSGNFDKRFASYDTSGLAMLCWNLGIHPTFTDIPSKDSAPLTSMLKTSLSTDLSTRVTQITIKDNGVDGGGGKSVEESSKSLKSLKGLKNLQRSSVWRNQASWLPTLG